MHVKLVKPMIICQSFWMQACNHGFTTSIVICIRSHLRSFSFGAITMNEKCVPLSMNVRSITLTWTECFVVIYSLWQKGKSYQLRMVFSINAQTWKLWMSCRLNGDWCAIYSVKTWYPLRIEQEIEVCVTPKRHRNIVTIAIQMSMSCIDHPPLIAYVRFAFSEYFSKSCCRTIQL